METNRITTDFTLRAENVAYFRTLLKKLSKRAVRIGLPELEFRTTGRTKEVRRDESVQWHTHIDVTASSPTLKGWAVVAVIEHTPGGDVIRDASAGRVDMTQFEGIDPEVCNHCKTRRSRKETVILQKDLTDLVSICRVGKNCLKDHLGGANVEKLMWYVSLHTTLGHLSDAKEAHDYGDRAPDGAPLVEYLSWVALCVRKFGWVSRAVARGRSDAVATADDALALMYGKPPRGAQRVYPSIQDTCLAELACVWSKHWLTTLDADTRNDYHRRVQVILNNGWTTRKQAGYAASIIDGYSKAFKQEEDRRDPLTQVSRHVGRTGKRELFNVVVESIKKLSRSHSEEYNATHLVTLTTKAGESLVWFASRDPELTVDRHYTIRATVKRHTEYLGVKQTAVNRCVVQEG